MDETTEPGEVSVDRQPARSGGYTGDGGPGIAGELAGASVVFGAAAWIVARGWHLWRRRRLAVVGQRLDGATSAGPRRGRVR